MKRQFSVFDGLFLMMLYFKLTGTNPVPTWVEVFIPYGVEMLFFIAMFIFNLKGGPERVKFWLWNLWARRRVDQAADRARNFMKENYEKGRANAQAGRPGGRESGNPGRFTDPSKEGK